MDGANRDAIGAWIEVKCGADIMRREITSALIEEGHDPAEAESLAGFVISAVEGAMMRARSERTATPLREAGRYVAQLLQPGR